MRASDLVGQQSGRHARRSIPFVTAVLAASLLTPSASVATTVTDAWKARIGTSGANGSARIELFTSGAGSLTLALTRIKPAASLPVVVRKGWCASAGPVVVKAAPIRTSRSGTASRATVLTAGQVAAIRGATTGTSTISVWVGAGSAARCGVFAGGQVLFQVTASLPVEREWGCLSAVMDRCAGLRAAAVGTGASVAVGSTGYDPLVLVSLGGGPWKKAPVPAPGIMSDVAVGGPGFVAVGAVETAWSDGLAVDWQARVWTSQDGATWLLAPDDPTFRLGMIDKVAASGTRVVALGDVRPQPDADTQTRIWSSADGSGWTPAKTPPLPATGWRSHMFDVIWDGARFVAVGGPLDDGGDPTVIVSSDGTAWSLVPLATPLPDVEFETIARGPAGYLATGGSGDGAWLSTDLRTWTQGAGRELRDLTASGSAYLGVTFTTAYASRDGQTWSVAHEFTPDVDVPAGVAADGDAFLIVGKEYVGDQENVKAMIWTVGLRR